MNTESNKQPGADGTAAASNHHAPAPPEQTIDAKLLYSFLKPVPLTYEQWMDSLRFRVATAEANRSRNNLEYRGIVWGNFSFR